MNHHDAWNEADPTGCLICGRHECEEHLPPPADTTTPQDEQPQKSRLALEVARLRVQRDARRLLDAEDRGPVPEPDFSTLRERLALPRLAVPYRIAGWQPKGARVMLAAQFKAGKTSLVGNLLRSLVDGDDWLGCCNVSPLVGTVALVDTEMATRQLDDWLREQKIDRDDGVIVVPLRGQVASLDLLDVRQRAQWVEWLRARKVEYLVLDCLRPVLDALGLDEHHEAGRFLTAFDALLKEARIAEALVVQHMGHLNERSRGDSRLRDWPDVEWRLVRQNDDPSSPRFITAYGRDVDQPESRLAYDRATRRLTLAGGSRRGVKVEAALEAVLALLSREPVALNATAIKKAIKARSDNHARDTIDDALTLGVEKRLLHVEDGPGHSKLYTRVSGFPGASGESPPEAERVSGGL